MSGTVSFDTFASLDIRVGIITKAEQMPNADKLLILTVDIGEESSRQIVAGIAPYVSSPASLEGQQVSIIANLEPRTLKGYESQGMLMCAGGDDAFALMQPAQAVPAGTPVR